MGPSSGHIPFSKLFPLFFLILPGYLLAQTAQKDRILREYFPENEARDQAVITARYAEAAHRFAYALIHPDPLSRGRKERDLHSDTARAFILHARRRIDSTLRYATDSSEMALRLLERARGSLKEGARFLKAYRRTEVEQERKEWAKKALYRTSDASVDAFHASMLLGNKGPKELPSPADSNRSASRPKMEDKNLYDLMKGIGEKEAGDYEKEASRLQVDRRSFRKLRDRYERELEEKEERMEEMRKKDASAERIDSLKEEKELLSLKKKDAGDQVEQIDEMLQKKLLKHIGVDTSDEEENVFQVDRWGYYEDRSIPIDEEQPSGLIYRIQVGYYSQGNRPEEKLEGLYPIWGKQVSDKYVRYCVGRFRGYEQADKAKEYLRRRKGFGDAFIVAYEDGEKIPVVEAIKSKD
jgi:hypothetical protein